MFCFYQEFYFLFYHTRIQQVRFPQSLPSDSRIVGAQKSIHCPPNCRHGASRLTTNKDSKLSLSCILDAALHTSVLIRVFFELVNSLNMGRSFRFTRLKRNGTKKSFGCPKFSIPLPDFVLIG